MKFSFLLMFIPIVLLPANEYQIKANIINEITWWKLVGKELSYCGGTTFKPCYLTTKKQTKQAFRREFFLENLEDDSVFELTPLHELSTRESQQKFKQECGNICSKGLDYLEVQEYIKQKTNTLLDSALEKYKMKVTNNIFIRGEFFENLHEKSILDKTILNDMSISYLIENPKEKVFNNKIKIKIDNHSKLIYYGKKNMSLKNYNECINLTKDMIELLTSKYILNKSSKYIHQTNMMTDTSYLGALQGSTKKRKQTIKVTQLDSVLHEQTAKITCTKNVLSLEYQDEKILKEVQNRHKKIKESNLRQKKNKEQEIETKRQQNSFKKLNDSL